MRAAVAVFKHPPGRGGHTESHIIGDVRDVLAQIPWGESKLGSFSEIVPAWDGLPVNEYFVTIISTSLKSKAARSMMARDCLKSLLPKNLHCYISLARKLNRMPKRFWETPDPETTPPLHQMTKCDLFVRCTLSEAERVIISAFIDPSDLWRAATGRTDWQDINDLVKIRQLKFSFPGG